MKTPRRLPGGAIAFPFLIATAGSIVEGWKRAEPGTVEHAEWDAVLREMDARALAPGHTGGKDAPDESP